MPPHDRRGRDDMHRRPPVWPDAREQHPKDPIDRTEARSFRRGPLQYGELMPEREDFGGELEPERNVVRHEASMATNSAVIVPENLSVSGLQPQRAQHVRNIW